METNFDFQKWIFIYLLNIIFGFPKRYQLFLFVNDSGIHLNFILLFDASAVWREQGLLRLVPMILSSSVLIPPARAGPAALGPQLRRPHQHQAPGSSRNKPRKEVGVGREDGMGEQTRTL